MKSGIHCLKLFLYSLLFGSTQLRLFFWPSSPPSYLLPIDYSKSTKKMADIPTPTSATSLVIG